MLQLLVARHGETDWNRERRLQGRINIPLNQQGRDQAQKLALRLQAVPLDCIYSSFLNRTIQTASALMHQVQRVPLSGFDEQALGSFEGRYIDGREPGVLEDYERRLSDPDDELDGGESRNQHAARVGVTLQMVLARHRQGRVLVIGHGVTNRLIFSSVFGYSYEEARKLHQANGEFYLLEVASTRPPRLSKRVEVSAAGELAGID